MGDAEYFNEIFKVSATFRPNELAQMKWRDGQTDGWTDCTAA